VIYHAVYYHARLIFEDEKVRVKYGNSASGGC